MKSRKHASPGDAVGNVYFLALRFVFFKLFVFVFSKFSMLKKKHHISLLQSERDICTRKKKHSRKTDNSGKVSAIHTKDKRLVFMTFWAHTHQK